MKRPFIMLIILIAIIMLLGFIAQQDPHFIINKYKCEKHNPDKENYVFLGYASGGGTLCVFCPKNDTTACWDEVEVVI